MRRFLAVTTAVFVAMTAGVVRGEQAEQAGVVSPMRVRDLPASAFYHATVETTMAKIGQAVAEKAGEVERAHPGPLVVVTHGAGTDPDRPVLVEVGTVVPDGTEARDGFTVKKLEQFRCATVIYGGPMKGIAAAYARAYKDLFAAGLRPTGESRQITLQFEGEGSGNNVVLVQIGVK
jgi:hypothetical protein